MHNPPQRGTKAACPGSSPEIRRVRRNAKAGPCYSKADSVPTHGMCQDQGEEGERQQIASRRHDESGALRAMAEPPRAVLHLRARVPGHLPLHELRIDAPFGPM